MPFMRYITARAAENTELVIYRFFCTSALKVIADSSSAFVNGGETLNMTYEEFREKAKGKKKVETRTGEEIAEHMKEVLRRIGGEKP